MPLPDGSMTDAERAVAHARERQQSGDAMARNYATAVKQGRDTYGSQFDEDVNHVAKKIGNERSFAFRDALVQSAENPAAVIRHLAENDDELDRLANLDPMRLHAAVTRLSDKVTPTRQTASTPAYLAKREAGYMAKKDFGSPLSDALTDSEWNANFDHHRRKLRK
jgi:hypothetical protein